MTTMRKLIAMAVLALGLSLSCPLAAKADANMCNASSHPIWVGFGEAGWDIVWVGFDSLPIVGDPDSSAWITGWFFVQPGQCAQPIVGDVCWWWADIWGNCYSAILYVAEDASGDIWGGPNGSDTVGALFCTTQNVFDEAPQGQPNTACAPGRSWMQWSFWMYSQPANSVTVNFTD
jgi:hypothetical protein